MQFSVTRNILNVYAEHFGLFFFFFDAEKAFHMSFTHTSICRAMKNMLIRNIIYQHHEAALKEPSLRINL